ncbi:MAG: hypothetical protein P8Y97_02610 [Candidatus Lokiarchaeota archaeon]
MKLFSVTNKGVLNTLEKLDFHNEDLYIVNDAEKNIIYLWNGSDVNQERRSYAADSARKIDKSQGGSCKILVMEQNEEYGSFLAIMEDLRKGLLPGISMERRPELILSSTNDGNQKDIDPTSRILNWWKQFNEMLGKSTKRLISEQTRSGEEMPDLETQIKEAAYFLSKENYSYSELCWFLAEKILNINMKMPSLDDIKKKAEDIYKSSSTYDELCWLNAELDILIKRGYLEPQKQVNWANYSL